MRTSRCQGRLYLNGLAVGNIRIRGWDGAWGFGEFTPDPAFARFAPLYDEWARLMHSPEINNRLTDNIAAALRKVECALYAIRARIYVRELAAWRKVDILNIDGRLIEWKEGWCDCDPARPAAAAAAAAAAGSVEGAKA
jgi:hypothetical protein